MHTAIIFDFFDVIHSDPFHAWLTQHGLVREGDQAAASRALDKGEIGYAKPDPEMFQHTLEKLGASPGETIFVDDNPNNVAAAEQLGITGIVFTGTASLQTALRDRGITW